MNTPKLDGICVLVDGGCLNNNRPVEQRTMYGSMTVFFNGDMVASEYRNRKNVVHKLAIEPVEGHASNNIAELCMLGSAMGYVKSLIERMRAKGQAVPQITVLSDSEFALCAITGEYRVKAKNVELQRITAEVKALYDNLEDIVLTHVDNLWVKSVLGH